MNLLPQKPVDEQLPPVNILNLVQEQILEIPVQPVQSLEKGVKLICLERDKTLVVKIDVSKIPHFLTQDFLTYCRLTTTPDPDNNLGHLTVKVDKRFLIAAHRGLESAVRRTER